MAHVVVLGAGLGGTIMAYELRDRLGKEHRVSVVTNGGSFFFVPSNPWVAVGWRDRKAVEVELAPALKARDIALHPQGAKRLDPAAAPDRAQRRRLARLRLSRHRHRPRARLRRNRRSGA